MRRSTKRMLWLMLAAAGAWGGPVPAQDGEAALRAAGCAGCHGERGRGTALAPAIAGPILSADEFLAAVRDPRGAMPAFAAESLPDDAVAGLYRFLSAQPPVAMPEGRIEAGARRYEAVGCYSCHSNQGQGGTQGPRIGPQPIPWTRFVWYVRHPAGQMPPYSDAVLSDQDLADIYAFLASRPAARPLSELELLAP